MEIFVKNGNFRQKWKFWSKIEILVKNPNFGQKSKFQSKIKIFVKNRTFGQKASQNQTLFAVCVTHFEDFLKPFRKKNKYFMKYSNNRIRKYDSVDIHSWTNEN